MIGSLQPFLSRQRFAKRSEFVSERSSTEGPVRRAQRFREVYNTHATACDDQYCTHLHSGFNFTSLESLLGCATTSYNTTITTVATTPSSDGKGSTATVGLAGIAVCIRPPYMLAKLRAPRRCCRIRGLSQGRLTVRARAVRGERMGIKCHEIMKICVV